LHWIDPDTYRSGNRCLNNHLLSGAAEHPAEAIARPIEANCGYENRSGDPTRNQIKRSFSLSEVIDFFAPPREDFLVGGKPAYMSEG
jgi:hypothetical protein